MNKREVRSTPHTIQKRKQSQGVINDLDNVDFVPSNVNSNQFGPPKPKPNTPTRKTNSQAY